MTSAKLVRHYLWETQTEIVICGVISSLFGFLFGVIGHSAPIILFSYLIGLGYMSLITLSIQDTYITMFNIMPIPARTIVRAHFNYYFSFCSIFGSIFVVLFILYSAFMQQFSSSLFIGMLLLTLCITLLFGNIVFWLYYRFQKESILFLAFIILSFLLGGYRFIFDFLQGISFTWTSIAMLTIISFILFVFTKFQIRYSVKLFLRKDFT